MAFISRVSGSIKHADLIIATLCATTETGSPFHSHLCYNYLSSRLLIVKMSLKGYIFCNDNI